MSEPCKKIKYKKKKIGKSIVNKFAPPTSMISDEVVGGGKEPSPCFPFEEVEREEEMCFMPPRNIVQELRNWVHKQRFIPQDLSDEFLTVFLTGACFDVSAAAEKLEKYFYSRQEPSYLFRQRDPFSPENVKLFDKLYVLPMPDTTENGCKIILMGSLEQMTTYNPVDHAKILAMVIDLLIWEKDFGFGDFVVVFDGRNFVCPQLLERKVNDHRSITSLLLNTIPGTLRSFYFLYPPSHVANVANSRTGIWITVVKSKQQMIGYLPADILPLEFGGNLGHLQDLLEQWYRHLAQSRTFFIHFEEKMINDYRRRICHEREVSEGGRAWVHHMKLFADEWEYKIQYYEKMKNAKPLKHPGFGQNRIIKQKQKKIEKTIDPLAHCKKLMKREREENLVFEPTYLYHGYAPEIRKAQKLEDLKRKQDFFKWEEGKFQIKNKSTIKVKTKRVAKEMAELEGEAGEGLPPPSPSKIAEEEGGEGEWPEMGGEDGEDVLKSDSEPEIDFHEELIQMNNWLNREPYLPKNIDEEVLITFLWNSESVQEAQDKLMNYYYARQSLKSVFTERHPCSPNNLLKYDAVCVVPLTSGLDKKWIIFATWLSHDDPTKFSIYHMMKLIFTELDILLQENQIRGKTISVIIDMNGYTEEHTQMITRFAAKKICHLFTDCFPAKFNGFYILNAPDHVADYTVLFGPFDFHLVEYLEDLPGFLPKKFLPSDLAGEPTAPTRASLFEPFFKRMRRCGNWLAYEEFIRSQEMLLRMTTTREEFSFGPLK